MSLIVFITIAHHDWENSRPLGLTDAGLLAELQGSDTNVAEDLALNPDAK